jgi:glyoxylase-like metal-dependent hydrolase (beta-lactamase superfamily II)
MRDNQMIVRMFAVGTLLTNCYLVGCEEKREAAVIDPGFDDAREAEKIMKIADKEKLRVKYIINTHGHSDHICGNRIMKEMTGAPILIHEYDAPMLISSEKNLSGMYRDKTTSPPADKLLHEGDIINVGNVKLKVVHTPGHSKGGLSLLCDDVVFTGDTLFAGSIGRYDFPRASYKELMNSIKTKLAVLPDHLKVYPGHGPTSTIGEEKRNNPFLQEDSPIPFDEEDEAELF